MSDVNDTTDEAPEGPVGGERLRAARRENNISVRDIAKELHLDELKVRALERNEFDLLGAPVFAKGHLRKYAELVGVPVDDIMSDYYQMNRSVGAPPVVGPKRRPSREINPGPWIGMALLAILLAAALYWWFGLREPAPSVPAVRPATLSPFSESPADAVDDGAEEDDAPPAAADPPAAAPPAGPSADEAPAAAAAPATDDSAGSATTVDAGIDAAYRPTPGAPQVSLALAFTGECWTEISDAGGRRLFYDLGVEGRVVTLSGDAPLRVILGNADNVDMTVDDESYTIPAAARRGRLARLTINPR